MDCQTQPSVGEWHSKLRGNVGIGYPFDEKVDVGMQKPVKLALRFFNELRKEDLANRVSREPPSFEDFARMARYLMDASKRVDLDRLRNLSLKELLERTWSQKLLNYATQKKLKAAYENLVRRF